MMGSGADLAVRSGAEQDRRARNSMLSHDLHRSVFEHLTRQMADPDHPGERISYGELELRLRGRAYRQAVIAGQGGSSA
jgi:hypothetical protein